MVAETEIAAAVVAWFTEEGWTVYQEVQAEGRIADIVAVRGEENPVSCIIEVKTSRTETVFNQADQWRFQANMVYIAAPKRKRLPPYSEWDFALHSRGIGELAVGDDGAVEIARSPVRVKVTDRGIRSYLHEGQRDFAEAGNADGKRFTRFQAIAESLTLLAKAHPGITLAEFVARTAHHYGSGDMAVETIRRLIRNGAIKGLIVKQGGKVYEEDHDHHSMKRKNT